VCVCFSSGEHNKKQIFAEHVTFIWSLVKMFLTFFIVNLDMRLLAK